MAKRLAKVEAELTGVEELARKVKAERDREVNDWHNRIKRTRKEIEVVEEEIKAKKEAVGVSSFRLFEDKYKV